MTNEVRDLDPKKIFHTQILLQQEGVAHQRKIYGWLDLLGDLGGVTEVVMICFGIFLFPISEHSFYMKAIKKLFLARTSEGNFFDKQKEGTA